MEKLFWFQFQFKMILQNFLINNYAYLSKVWNVPINMFLFEKLKMSIVPNYIEIAVNKFGFAHVIIIKPNNYVIEKLF